MMLKTGLFVSLLVTIFISYNIQNEYYPDGLSQPLLMKTVFYTTGIVNSIVTFLARVGVVDFLHAKRITLEFIINPIDLGYQDIQKEDTTMDGVPVRIYRPKEHSNSAPSGMIYYHGGGWTLLSIDVYDPVTNYFSRRLNMVVISVGYRLNPEHSQKDGLDDCLKVTKHVIKMAGKYGIDPERVVVSGDSTGGNYAAAVSLILRDEQFMPMPKIQMLIYPVVQAIDLELPSYQENIHGPLLTPEFMHWFFSQMFIKNNSFIPYLQTNTHVPDHIRQHYAKTILDHNQDAIPQENRYPPYVRPNYDSGDSEIWDKIKDQILDPYHYPLMAKNHKGLPEAYIFTGHYDILRDEGYIYAAILRNAGIKVTHDNLSKGWHGMIQFIHINNDSKDAIDKMCAFLRENL